MQKQHDKRPDIQGLRAWAVIAVVVFHFFPALLPFGYLGVDVFFVLSGFLITLVLEGRPVALVTYYNFYFKRLRRILPLALLIVLLCVLTIVTLQTDYELTNGIKSALYSMFFIKNYQPHASLEDDYFQALEKGDDMFTHFWSLCVEIQFYLLAPFLLHLLKPSADNALASFAFMTAIAAASFAYSLLSKQAEAFDDTPARLWQFLAGAMAFHADSAMPQCLSKWKALPQNEELVEDVEEAGLLKDVENEDAGEEAPIPRRNALLIPGLFAAAASVSVLCTGDWEITLRFFTTSLATVVLVFRPRSLLFCHASLQLIGDVSYSLYLIHWPVACVLEIFEVEAWQAKVAAMAAALTLAVLCHYAYEKRYLTLSATWTFILVIGLYMAILFAIFASSNLQWKKPESSATAPPPITGSLRELTQEEIDEENTKLSRTNDFRYKGCRQRDGGNPIGSCDLDASLFRSKFYWFIAQTYDSQSGNGTLSFLIMGNSYSANLGMLVQKHFVQYYGTMQERAIAQCEPLVPTAHDHYCPDYTVAHAKFDADIERERPDVLFLIARYIRPNYAITRPIETDELFLFMEKRLKYFEERVNKRVFIMNAFPRPARADDFDRKMKKLGKPITPYMPEAVEADAKPMKERVLKLAERCKKCVIFDIEPVFLNEAGNFTVYSPQKLKYFDNPRHLNALGRQLVEPVFQRLAQNFVRLLDSKYPDNIFIYE